jgi:hypothetical protein
MDGFWIEDEVIMCWTDTTNEIFYTIVTFDFDDDYPVIGVYENDKLVYCGEYGIDEGVREYVRGYLAGKLKRVNGLFNYLFLDIPHDIVIACLDESWTVPETWDQNGDLYKNSRIGSNWL